LVGSIADEDQRYNSAEKVARFYRRNDETAAAKWIHSLDLATEKKNRLIKAE